MSGWLAPGELRVGLGTMRLPAAAGEAQRTVAAAVEAGITVFDTARAYGPDPACAGHNERLLAGALRACGATRARIVTKGGMTRVAATWLPDGRARAIRADCEASLAALGGRPVDLYLLHAPDPRTPWETSVRALARLVDEGLVARVGVANVNRDQLDRAVEVAPIAAVQVALSLAEDGPLRGGVLERCDELGIAVIAHSPLGGPRRAGALGRYADLSAVATAHGATEAEVALAWLLGLSPGVIAIPGATRPETARSAARAATLALDDGEQTRLTAAFTGIRPTASRSRGGGEAEVVLIMGIPGAGKTRLAREYVARGYVRLNRDERGGRLRELSDALKSELAAGRRRVVLDSTYLTRAARSHVLDAAALHDVPVRCVWLDTPLAQAQVNLVTRLLEPEGTLPGPEQLRTRTPGVMAPTSQMRALRELEEPGADEGFARVERRAFTRARTPGAGAVFLAAAALRQHGWEAHLGPGLPHLVFDWRPGADPGALDGEAARVGALVGAPVEAALCPHDGGPPRCWCRPPLPGLPLAFAHRYGIEPSRSLLIGTSSAHRRLAETLGARFVAPVA